MLVPNKSNSHFDSLSVDEATMDLTVNRRSKHHRSRRCKEDIKRSIGSSLQSLQDLDKIKSSAKNVRKSISRHHNDEDHASMSSTIFTSSDNHSLFTHKNLIDNIQDICMQHHLQSSQYIESQSARSKVASRSGRSTSRTSVRSRRRSSVNKDQLFEIAVTHTILKSSKIDNACQNSIFSSTVETGVDSSTLSTEDILQDLIQANAVLANEILSLNQNGAYPITASSQIITPPTPLRSSNEKTSSIVRIDKVDAINKTNLLPPVLSQPLEDDETNMAWADDRVEEPHWAGVINDNIKSKREKLTRTKFMEKSNLFHEEDSFDAWTFEEVEFPNSKIFRPDTTKSSKLLVTKIISQVKEIESQRKIEDWDKLGRTPFLLTETDDSSSNDSPSSICVDQTIDESMKSIQAPSTDGVWKRRLQRRGVVNVRSKGIENMFYEQMK